MFNVGPMELLVLAIVGLIVLGPDKLPGLARDAARMLRTLRDLATGARQQLRDELGPEFADVDLRNLNPRTALRILTELQQVDRPRREQLSLGQWPGETASAFGFDRGRLDSGARGESAECIFDNGKCGNKRDPILQ